MVVASADMPPEGKQLDRLKGEVRSLPASGALVVNGQAWVACATCHWDSLSDQVTWFHIRGPRQSPSLDGTFNSKNHLESRLMNWNAIVDELEDHEGGRLAEHRGWRGRYRDGAHLGEQRAGRARKERARGAQRYQPMWPPILPRARIWSPTSRISMTRLKSGRFKRPSHAAEAVEPRCGKVAAGKDLFVGANCQGCHGGDMWTIAKRFYTPDANVAPATISTRC